MKKYLFGSITILVLGFVFAISLSQVEAQAYDYKLVVSLQGPGTVVSNPQGVINCNPAVIGFTCINNVTGPTTLTAVPNSGARFTGWSPGILNNAAMNCSGTGSCTVSATGGGATQLGVVATFEAFRITITNPTYGYPTYSQENFPAGTVIPVRWTSGGYTGNITFDIMSADYSRTIISESIIGNPEKYDYTIPPSTPAGSYFVRVRGNGGLSWYVPFTITTSPVITSLKINNSSGPLYVPYHSLLNFTWTSSNALYCYNSSQAPGWEKWMNRPISGYASHAATTTSGSYAYSLTCGNYQGSIYDATSTVIVNVSNSGVLPPFSTSTATSTGIGAGGIGTVTRASSNLIATLSPITPPSQNWTVSDINGLRGLTMQVIDLRSENGISTVKSIDVGIGANYPATPTALHLYDGSTLIASGSNDFHVLFNDLSIAIASNQTKSLTLKGDFPNLNAYPSTVHGVVKTFVSSKNITYTRSNGSLASSTPSVPLDGYDQHLYKSAPQWRVVGTPTITTTAGVKDVASSSVSGTITLRARAMGGAMTKPSASNFTTVFASTTPPRYSSYNSSNSIVGGNRGITVSPSDATIGEGNEYTVTITDTIYSNSPQIGSSQYLFMAIKDIDSLIGGNAITNQTWGLETFVTPYALLTKGTFLAPPVKTPTPYVTPTPAPTPLTSNPTCHIFNTNFGIGTESADVAALQRFLVSKGYLFGVTITNYFGEKTKAALATFQTASNITPAEGFLGEKTRGVINASCNSIILPGPYPYSSVPPSVSVTPKPSTSATPSVTPSASTIPFPSYAPTTKPSSSAVPTYSSAPTSSSAPSDTTSGTPTGSPAGSVGQKSTVAAIFEALGNFLDFVAGF